MCQIEAREPGLMTKAVLRKDSQTEKKLFLGIHM